MYARKPVYTTTPLLRHTTGTIYTSALPFTLCLKLKYWSDPHIVFIMQEQFN